MAKTPSKPAKTQAPAKAQTASSTTAHQKPPENPPASKPPAAAGKKGKGEIPGLFVRTRRGVQRFRRAGFAFGRDPIGIALDALTEDQIKALRNEPNLVVEEGAVLVDEAQ